MESFGVPLIGGVSEHKSLISCSHVFFIFVQMYALGNFGRLSVHINDYLTIIAVNTLVIRSESNLFESLSSNLLKGDFVFID